MTNALAASPAVRAGWRNIVGANSGLGADYLRRVMQTYVLAMPVAFVCVMVVRPLVGRLVAATVHL